MNNINMLTVYLGSSGFARPVFKKAAEELGCLISKHKKMLVYGGMDAGLMGTLARSTMKSGAHVTGIVPRKIKDSERIQPGLSETIMVDDLCDRKKQMFLMADAVLALPGGYGTLDESLEVLYWGALGLHSKPIVFINLEGYWSPFLEYVKDLPDFDERFLIVVETVEEALTAMKNFKPLPPVKVPPHLPHFEDEISRGTDSPIIIDRASLENTYFVICALGLKQLGKTQRPIGFLNLNGQFNALIAWIERAAEEHFITDKCRFLFDIAETREALFTKLDSQQPVEIDLHKLKWGEGA